MSSQVKHAVKKPDHDRAEAKQHIVLPECRDINRIKTGQIEKGLRNGDGGGENGIQECADVGDGCGEEAEGVARLKVRQVLVLEDLHIEGLGCSQGTQSLRPHPGKQGHIERRRLPKCDHVLLSDAVLVGQEHENRGDDVSKAQCWQEDLGDIRWNRAASRAGVYASAGGVNAEKEVDRRDLSDTEELVNGEDGGHGDQRPDVAVAVALDRPDVDQRNQVDQEIEALNPLVGVGACDLLREGPHQYRKKVVDRWKAGVCALRSFL